MSQQRGYDPNDRSVYSRETVNSDEYDKQQADQAVANQGSLGDAAKAAAAKRAAATLAPAPAADSDKPPSQNSSDYASPLAMAAAMAEYKRRHPQAAEPKFSKPKS